MAPRTRVPRFDKLRTLEEAVLRALCAPGIGEALRQKFCIELADYPWHEEDHRIVFEAIRGIKNAHAFPIQEQIAGYATRKGFPDLDLTVFLVAGETEDLQTAITEMKRAGSRNRKTTR